MSERRVVLTYGELTVLDAHDPDGRGRARRLVTCSCGRLALVLAAALRSGQVTSCGCRDAEPGLHDGVIVGPRPDDQRRIHRHAGFSDLAGAPIRTSYRPANDRRIP